MTTSPPDADEKRRRATTDWWERQSLREFIARIKSEDAMTTPSPLVEAVARAIEAPFLPHGYELKPHLLRSAAQATITAVRAADRSAVSLCSLCQAECAAMFDRSAVSEGVTDAMVEAGVRAMYDTEKLTYRERVPVIYTAMRAADPDRARLVSAAARIVEWWPENSENGPAGQRMGEGFAADIAALRALLATTKAHDLGPDTLREEWTR